MLQQAEPRRVEELPTRRPEGSHSCPIVKQLLIVPAQVLSCRHRLKKAVVVHLAPALGLKKAVIVHFAPVL
jgi:hypothetical protein